MTINNLSFDIRTSVDFFQKLKEDYSEFMKDKTSSRIALNCAMTAWHLIEWVFHEYNTNKKLDNFQNEIKNKCSSMQIMKDISNGTKHYLLTKSKPEIKKTSLSKGSFDNGFNRDFDISTLDVEYNDGTEVFFEDEIENVIDFWENYFKTELSVNI